MGVRNHGLLHGRRRVEVQAVKERVHRTPCADCSKAPQVRRLAVTDGSGRNAITKIFCIDCGQVWLRERREEYVRATEYLGTGLGKIRIV